MFYRTISLTSLITLAACGGSSSSGPTIVPVSASGFATAGAAVTTGDSFAVQNAFRAVQSDDGTFVLDSQDVDYSISTDGTEVAVTVAGVDYVTTFINGRYQFIDGDDFVTIFRVDAQVAEAELVEVLSFIDGNTNSSLVVIGEDTNPSEVASLTGSASLTGEIFVDARNQNGAGFASGPIELNVDFSDSSVSGEFSLTDNGFSVANFAIPTSSFDLDQTDIVGNGFAGSITQTSGDFEGTLSSAAYNGRFFGQDAPTAGGQIGAVVTDGDENVTVITGGFVVTE